MPPVLGPKSPLSRALWSCELAIGRACLPSAITIKLDPETQPIMMRLKSDLVELCNAALSQNLANTNTEWDKRSALGVVLAAGDYPDSYAKGAVISGLPSSENTDSKVFHAGTQLNDGQVVTAGGRVYFASRRDH
jgi:phosphoribosylamine--glycine ligase